MTESGITWLEQAGLVTKVRRISKPGLPLCPYADDAAFKLFLLDIGLLGAMVRLDKSTVIGGSAIFEEFKGALTEQYVCQQLVSECGFTPYYWSAENSSGEIDFLAQGDNQVYAIEVKAEENLRSKSLRAFKAEASLGERRALQHVGISRAGLDAQRPAVRNPQQSPLEPRR